MDHLYDYYKTLPRVDVVGGTIEFTGAGEIDEDDIELSDDESIRAEIYGAADHIKSASTVDEGILRLFGDDELRQINPKKSRETPEDARTDMPRARVIKPAKKPYKRRATSKKGGDSDEPTEPTEPTEPDTRADISVEGFSLDTPDEISAETFAL